MTQTYKEEDLENMFEGEDSEILKRYGIDGNLPHEEQTVASPTEEQKEKVRKKSKKKERPDNLPDFVIWKSEKIGYITGLNSCLFTQIFLEKYKNLIYKNTYFYFYNSNCYQQLEDEDIKAKILNFIKSFDGPLLNEFVKTKHINELLDYLKIEKVSIDKNIKLDNNPHLFFLKNYIYNTNTDEIIKHDRKYYNTTKIDVNYNSKATCPIWKNVYLKTTFPKHLYQEVEKVILKLQEWGGYACSSSTIHSVCLMLYGNGANGKSIFLRVLKMILGDNASNISLKQLFGNNTTFRSRLMGKTANISTDTSLKNIDTDEFKSCVSGEETTADVKFHPSVTFIPIAKFLFATNKIQPSRDTSEGYTRRFDVIEFREHFPEEKQDLFLLQKLEKELEGILLWFLEGYKRLNKNKKFTKSLDFEENKKEFCLSQDPLQEFLNNNYIKTKNQNDNINKNVFFNEFINFCISNNYQKISTRQISIEMKYKNFPTVRKNVDKKKVSFFTNLKKET